MNEVKPDKSKKYDKYEIDNAIRTLHEAEEIKGNAALMKLVKPAMNKKVQAMTKAHRSISSTDDIRAARNEMVESEDES